MPPSAHGRFEIGKTHLAPNGYLHAAAVVAETVAQLHPIEPENIGKESGLLVRNTAVRSLML
jgi:hypothetical protein